MNKKLLSLLLAALTALTLIPIGAFAEIRAAGSAAEQAAQDAGLPFVAE